MGGYLPVAGFLLDKFTDDLHDQMFVFRIAEGGGFVENEHGGILQDDAGQLNALLLAAT